MNNNSEQRLLAAKVDKDKIPSNFLTNMSAAASDICQPQHRSLGVLKLNPTTEFYHVPLSFYAVLDPAH